MTGGMFLLQGNDDLIELTEQQYDSEHVLQSLLAKYPNLLASDRLGTMPRRWLLVSREAAIPSEEGAGGRWSVDHLFLDQDAIPTLVEVKRSTDTRIRREVVGQMLDYAANAMVYWRADRLRATFEANCEAAGQDPEGLVQSLVGPEEMSEGFWDRVQTNLSAGKVRLLFVADEIPTELRRVIEFLNVQMSPAEVLGVEIRQYAGQNLKTLVPSVIGQTTEAQQRKTVGPSVPRRGDWSWDAYAAELHVSAQKIEVGRTLFAAVEAVIGERQLPWTPVFRQGYVAFQRAGGYNAVLVDVWWSRLPVLAIKLPRSPAELGLTSPYPALQEIWNPNEKQWGWLIPSVTEIPDVRLAIDLTVPYQPASGPMVIPNPENFSRLG